MNRVACLFVPVIAALAVSTAVTTPAMASQPHPKPHDFKSKPHSRFFAMKKEPRVGLANTVYVGQPTHRSSDVIDVQVGGKHGSHDAVDLELAGLLGLKVL